jgi:hypothetical protein
MSNLTSLFSYSFWIDKRIVSSYKTSDAICAKLLPGFCSIKEMFRRFHFKNCTIFICINISLILMLYFTLMVFLRRTEACRCKKQSLGMWQGTIGETCFIHDDKYTKHSYGVVLIFFCAALDCPVTPRNRS